MYAFYSPRACVRAGWGCNCIVLSVCVCSLYTCESTGRACYCLLFNMRLSKGWPRPAATSKKVVGVCEGLLFTFHLELTWAVASNSVRCPREDLMRTAVTLCSPCSCYYLFPFNVRLWESLIAGSATGP